MGTPSVRKKWFSTAWIIDSWPEALFALPALTANRIPDHPGPV
jgi:hypothetical protein